MKIAATLFALASASGANSADVVNANCRQNSGNQNCWESYFTLGYNNATGQMEPIADSTTGSCGLQYANSYSMVNSTCKVIKTAGANLAFGNGAFVSQNGDITGLDGISGSVSVIATWETTLDAARWTAENTVNGTLEVTNMTEFNQDDCFTTGLNREINVFCTDNGQASSGPMIMMTNNAKDAANNFAIGNYGAIGDTLAISMNVPCNTTSISSPQGNITPALNQDCSFSIEVTDDAADILYFTATTEAVVDFFAVSIQ